MSFKPQNNKGKKLVIGKAWPGRQTLWQSMIRDRPQASPYLARTIVPEINPLATLQRGELGQCAAKFVYENMVWRSDQQVFGKVDYYASMFLKILANIFQKKSDTDVYGDCDDFACTWLEIMLAYGIDPQYLLFMQVLTKNGQRNNHYKKLDHSANHNIAAVILANGDIQIMDSDQARNDYRMIIPDYPLALTLQQTSHRPYILHRLSNPPDVWHYGEMK